MKDAERIRNVAKLIVAEADRGNQVVVAVSAMGKTTDNLIALARELSEDPPPREMDMLLATGEQISIAMLAIALSAMGRRAISFTGPQVGIRTDRFHGRARIAQVNDARMRKALNDGYIVIVAGFQGVTEDEEITTLGRGGSDTTAVALAAALKADLCDIYTDVDGVYTADPRICKNARRLPRITYGEMLELASQGAKVLHNRSVELAMNHRVPLRVLSSYDPGPGTMVVEEYENMEDIVVSGASLQRNESKVSILGVPDKAGMAARIFTRLGEANIPVDMIIQNVAAGGRNDISFTINNEDFARAVALSEAIVQEIGAKSVETQKGIAKLSVVGIGMRSHAGVAAKMFQALAAQGISINTISTSEICVSCIVDLDRGEEALRAIHDAFDLGAD